MGPTLGFDTKQRNSFLIKFDDFYNEKKILTILFMVKYENITLFDEFLVLLGPIISRLFTCSNEEKNKQKQQRVLVLILSLWTQASNVGMIRQVFYFCVTGINKLSLSNILVPVYD
jgi:hypothetical protein